MAAYYNRVIIAGNLTRDPQVRFLSNEKAVTNFGLAINNRYRDKNGESKEEVTFVDVTCWGRTAELVGQYLTKGSSCLIEGRLKLDSWEQDGERKSKLTVTAESVQFLDSRKSEGRPPPQQRSEPQDSAPSVPPAVTEPDDEPPF